MINPDLWHDECALAWNIKFKNYDDFFGVFTFYANGTAVFYGFNKLVTKIFGISDITLRILPFLGSVGSIIAFYFLAEKTIKSKVVALWAVFFFAINQRLIDYSFEFKPYSFDVFFAIILLLFFMSLDLEKLNAKNPLCTELCFAIVPWFSFTSVFHNRRRNIKHIFESSKKQKASFPSFLFPLSSIHQWFDLCKTLHAKQLHRHTHG